MEYCSYKHCGSITLLSLRGAAHALAHRSCNHTGICLRCEGKHKVHSTPRSLLECGHQVHPYCCWDLWRMVCGCHQNDWPSTRAKDGIFPNWCYLLSFSEACSQPLEGKRLHVDHQNIYFIPDQIIGLWITPLKLPPPLILCLVIPISIVL